MLMQAITKIDAEVKDFKGDQIGKVIYTHVAEVLKNFCRQEPEFAQAVVQTDMTLSDCCKEITKGISKSNAAISDIETYRRAVQFYFPGAGIQFAMTINLCASVEADPPQEEKPQCNIIHLSLDELIDF